MIVDVLELEQILHPLSHLIPSELASGCMRTSSFVSLPKAYTIIILLLLLL